MISSQKIWDRGAGLNLALVQTELVTREENLIGLMALNWYMAVRDNKEI